MKKKSDLYQTLGVDPTATPEQIKKARRKKAAAVHPDKGGDHEQMAAINRAYDVLSDPERRRRYDATGEEKQSVSLTDEARQMIVMVFQSGLDQNATRVLPFAIKRIRELQQEAKAKQTENERRRETLTTRSGKIQVKSGENLFQSLLDQRLRELDQIIASFQHGQKVCAIALELLADYTSEEPEPEAPSFAKIEEALRMQMHYFASPIGGNPFR